MIEAKELRIGNYLIPIDAYNSKPFAIDAGDILEIRKGSTRYKYAPIPLTPEILEKCGFHIVNHIHGYSFYAHKKYKIDIYKTQTQWMGYIIKHIQFLHELQNALPVLHGDELAIKFNPLPAKN